MNKTYLSLLSLLFLFLITTSVSAQLSVKLAGKTYKIPEFNNTIALPHDPYLLKIDSEYMSYILKPLSLSPYPFEARCSFNPSSLNDSYLINVLRCNNDSLWWEEYSLRRREKRMPGAKRYIELKNNDIISIS